MQTRVLGLKIATRPLVKIYYYYLHEKNLVKRKRDVAGDNRGGHVGTVELPAMAWVRG